MPQKMNVYRVFIASPSDCGSARRAVPEVLAVWNRLHSRTSAIMLDAVLWETHSWPEMGGRPQAIINRQLVDDCDVLIGIFWTRLGSPTGEFESGTVEEIEQFRASGKPVLLYFNTEPVVPAQVYLQQLEKLQAFREKMQREGIVSTYDEDKHLRELVLGHLTALFNDRRRRAKK